VLLLSLVLASCFPARPRPTPEPWQPHEFLIGLRGAPPPKSDAYAQAAAAGFNVIVDYVGPEALDLARRHGLKLMVAKIGLDLATFRQAEGRRAAAALIERFRAHPALGGYYLGDEAREADFADYARLADVVRERDSPRPFFLGLLPCDAFVGPALSTADYAGYLERFIATVSPALLTWAYHPFREKGEDRFYFENLELVRRAALAHDLPLCPTLRASVWRGMAPLGEGELRGQVYTALAYGAKGIAWFSYWGAPEGGRDGIVQPDGTLTERYRWVAALNAELRALGPTLLRLRSAEVCHTGDVPPGAARLPTHALVGSVEGGAFVVGLLDGGGTHERYVMLASKDFRRGATATLTVNRPCRSIAWLDPSSGRWQDLPIRADRFQTAVEFPLPPGGGRLLRLTLQP